MKEPPTVKWFSLLICLLLGVALLVFGLLVPAHLQVVDTGLLQRVGRTGPAYFDRGMALAQAKELGAAQLYAQAAQIAGISDWERFSVIVTNLMIATPAAVFWGNDTVTANIFNSPGPHESTVDYLVPLPRRQAALANLQKSSAGGVQALLQTRTLNNTFLFPPSASAAGQSFDVAVAECGLLMDRQHLMPSLDNSIGSLATQANHGGGSEPLEQVLMDFVSLGERFNWNQLVECVGAVPDVTALHRVADAVRGAGDKLPVLFVAVQLSRQPNAVAEYVTKFSQTGYADLTASLRYGANGVGDLVLSGQRLYQPDWTRQISFYEPFSSFYRFATGIAVHQPVAALVLKWFCYLTAGFFLVPAVHFSRPTPSAWEQPLQVRGVHWFRELLFSLGFLLVVLFLSEPFLAPENQGGHSFRLLLPIPGGAVPAGVTDVKSNIMNPTIPTLLLFLVLQTLIYLASLLKLAEIRRQNIPPRMKLKLLENEDHLFDAGLYLGFVGTIVSLIVASMGLVKFSLMAAYSCTSFGIIFVCVFKIFNLRPARRKLLIEAELADQPANVAVITPVAPVTPTSPA